MTDVEIVNVPLDTDGEASPSTGSQDVQGKEANQSDSRREDSSSKSKPNEQRKTSKARCGVDVAIAPDIIAKVRKMERMSSNSALNNFFTLSASADRLLPGKPDALNKDKKAKAEPHKETEDKGKDEEDKERKEKARKRQREEDIERERERKKEKEDEFYCELCCAKTNSLLTYEAHVQGKKHQKKLASYNLVDEKAEQYRTEEGPTLRSKPKKGVVPKIQTKIDLVECPVIGLSYISEIWRLDADDEIVYLCKLCSSQCQSTTIISHILGYRHRLCYLKMHLPNVYENVKNMGVKKSELSKILEKHAHQLEELTGRGKMTVEEEINYECHSPESFERPYSSEEFRGPFSHSRSPESERCFRQDFAVDFKVGDMKFYPSETRMSMLQELVSIEPEELKSSEDVSRLEYVIENFKHALADYRNRNRLGPPSTAQDMDHALDTRYEPRPTEFDRSFQGNSFDDGGFRREVDARDQSRSFNSSLPDDGYDGAPRKDSFGVGELFGGPSMERKPFDQRPVQNEHFGSRPQERYFDRGSRRDDMSSSEHFNPSMQDRVFARGVRRDHGMRTQNESFSTNQNASEAQGFGNFTSMCGPSNQDVRLQASGTGKPRMLRGTGYMLTKNNQPPHQEEETGYYRAMSPARRDSEDGVWGPVKLKRDAASMNLSYADDAYRN